jgi:hypothetical protein
MLYLIDVQWLSEAFPQPFAFGAGLPCNCSSIYQRGTGPGAENTLLRARQPKAFGFKYAFKGRASEPVRLFPRHCYG